MRRVLTKDLNSDFLQYLGNQIVSDAIVRTKKNKSSYAVATNVGELHTGHNIGDVNVSSEIDEPDYDWLRNSYLFFIIAGFLFLLISLETLLSGHALAVAYTVVSLIVFSFLASLAVYRLRRNFAVLEVMVLFTGLQWLIAPVFFYSEYSTYSNMAVSAVEYFKVVLLGYLCLLAGIYFPKLDVKIVTVPVQDNLQIGVLLILLGMVAFFLHSIVPLSLRHVFFVYGFLLNTGAFYIYFSRASFSKWIYLLPVMAFLTVSVANEGMFKFLVFWLMMFAMLWVYKNRTPYVFIILGTLVFVFLVVGIQAVKHDYRQATWSNDGLEKIGDVPLLGSLLYEQLGSPGGLLRNDAFTSFLSRINQGEVISRTIAHVPANEPYANGETIRNAVVGALVPRVLWPNKPVAGGGDIYPRFTGSQLIGNTSVNISPMGEAYVNFGRWGGAVVLFVFGLLCAGYVKALFAFCKNNARFIFWLPILLEPLIFNATEFSSIFNSVIKNTFLFLMLVFLFKKVLSIKLL